MRSMLTALALAALLVLPTVACGPDADDAAPETNTAIDDGAVTNTDPMTNEGDVPPVPDAVADAFVANDEPFVSAANVGAALDAGMAIQFVDARPEGDFEFGHIPGAINIVYSDATNYDVTTLPKDRWMVAYCECPHAEAQQVYDALHGKGISNIKVLDEGLAGWRDVLGRDLETSSGSSEG